MFEKINVDEDEVYSMDNDAPESCLIRENLNIDTMLVLKFGKIFELQKSSIFLKRNGFDGVVRILNKDYSQINRKSKYFTHFNLSQSNHVVGKKYLLPRIVKSGYYNSDSDFLLPILDFNNTLIVKCVDVKENLSYSDLKQSYFRYSMVNIKTKVQLKKQMIYRYSKSMPNLSNDDIINCGVGLTNFEIIGEFNGVFEYDSYINYLNESKSEFISTREGFGEGIIDAKYDNEDVVALTADLKSSVKLDKFESLFKNDFYEFSISEQNMMSAAAGMCLVNKIPFVTSFAVFNPGRNWDQLRVSVCYSNHNVKVLGSHAGLTTGPDGATHQALEDIAITRVLPNLKVVVPCDFEEAKKATVAIAKNFGPIYMRVSREKSLRITNDESVFKLGIANVLDEGDDVTIIACGFMVQFALKARDELLNLGIKASVINMHTIKPIDKKTIIKYAKLTGCIVSVEEHQKIGGLGSAIAEVLVENYLVPMEIIGVEDTFGESGESLELLEKYGLSVDNIIKKVKKVIKRKNNIS